MLLTKDEPGKFKTSHQYLYIYIYIIHIHIHKHIHTHIHIHIHIHILNTYIHTDTDIQIKIYLYINYYISRNNGCTQLYACTLKVLNFVGIKFRDFRDF